MPDGKVAYHNGRKLQQHPYSKITVTTDFTPYYYGFFRVLLQLHTALMHFTFEG